MRFFCLIHASNLFENSHSLEKSESIPSILSNEEQLINDIARSHAEIAQSLKNSQTVKMRTPKKRGNVSPKRQKELFEIKRKSFEAGEKRLSSSGEWRNQSNLN